MQLVKSTLARKWIVKLFSSTVTVADVGWIIAVKICCFLSMEPHRSLFIEDSLYLYEWEIHSWPLVMHRSDKIFCAWLTWGPTYGTKQKIIIWTNRANPLNRFVELPIHRPTSKGFYHSWMINCNEKKNVSRRHFCSFNFIFKCLFTSEPLHSSAIKKTFWYTLSNWSGSVLISIAYRQIRRMNSPLQRGSRKRFPPLKTSSRHYSHRFVYLCQQGLTTP